MSAMTQSASASKLANVEASMLQQGQHLSTFSKLGQLSGELQLADDRYEHPHKYQRMTLPSAVMVTRSMARTESSTPARRFILNPPTS